MTTPSFAKGQLFVVAAPSGAGKTSLVRALINADDDNEVAVSHTTRPMRPGEIDGVNYHFVSEAEFLALEAEEGFLETARVFGNLYGTSIAAVEQITHAGKHIVLEIDWQGAKQIRERAPESTHIFILPPSLGALRARLNSRGQDDASTIENRMSKAISEMSHYGEFDYLIINDDFDTALGDLQRIVAGDGEDLRMPVQQQKHHSLLEALVPPAA